MPGTGFENLVGAEYLAAPIRPWWTGGENRAAFYRKLGTASTTCGGTAAREEIAQVHGIQRQRAG